MNRNSKKFNVFLLIVCILMILAITVFTRQSDFVMEAARSPFWSYIDWINGDFSLGPEIILNICLFMPLGFVLALLIGERKFRWLIVLLSGVVLSLIIETSQYFLKLGLAEFDDVFNNTLGAMAGLLVFVIFDRIFKDKTCLKLIGSAAVLLGCIFVVWEVLQSKEDNGAAQYAFQIESVEDGKITGYAFPYEVDSGTIDYKIILEDTETGTRETLPTQTEIEREDVNQYFNGSSSSLTDYYDYTKTGFTAEYTELPESVKVFIRWDGVGIRDTGIYIVDGRVQCTDDEALTFDEGSNKKNKKTKKESDEAVTSLQQIVDSGEWLVHTKECACDVYQLGDKLYWVTGPDFNFESDGSTYIQYQLGTTKPEQLPEDRQVFEFDNIGFIFEDYEITDSLSLSENSSEKSNLNGYRVSVCSIPETYPITYILTGYYENFHWIWEEYTRPVIKYLK